MEILAIVLGLVMIYSVIHFFCLQTVAWSKRTKYEKGVTVLAVISILVIIFGQEY